MFSITADGPAIPPGRKPGRCMAKAWRRPLFRLAARDAAEGPPLRPRVLGWCAAEGALAKGISEEREVEGTARTAGSGPSVEGVAPWVTGLPGIVSSHSKELSS